VGHSRCCGRANLRRLAGVDIFKLDADGRAIEHWHVLKVVGGPNNAVPGFAPNVPAANTNGMF
jgi:predicted SnoaL-like aldol condensation-catalyzing enzyme